MLEKVISGGQDGADTAGLFTAHQFGIPTGGVMPNNYMTLSGPNVHRAVCYDLIEHHRREYPPRTYENVRLSDGTVRFAHDFQSAGEVCTLKAIEHYRRPSFDVPLYNPPHPSQVKEWVEENKIKILNVAGNSPKTASLTVTQEVIAYLWDFFLLLVDPTLKNPQLHTCTRDLQRPWILCKICGWESHNPNDCTNLYCGKCHHFHSVFEEQIRSFQCHNSVLWSRKTAPTPNNSKPPDSATSKVDPGGNSTKEKPSP